MSSFTMLRKEVEESLASDHSIYSAGISKCSADIEAFAESNRDLNSDVLELMTGQEKFLAGLDKSAPQFREDIKILKERTSAREKERDRLKKELDKLKDEIDQKTKQLKKIKKDIRDYTFKKQITEQKMRPSSRDEILLEKQKKELVAYKHTTGISWDFSTPLNIVAGCVTNKRNKFVKCFEFDTKIQTRSQVTEELWKLLKESGIEDWDNLVCDKENAQANN